MEVKDYINTADHLHDIGLFEKDNKVRFSIPNAEESIRQGLKWRTGENAKWLPEYENVANWLSNNNGKGLLMYGHCGRGKTLLGRYIIPALLNYYCKKVVMCYTSQEMNMKPEEVLSRHIVYIDDIGVEDVSSIYGNKRLIFPELCDAAERMDKLLIVSTNLTPSEIIGKYGERTIDRLKAVCSAVLFKGESLRG